MQVKIAFSFLLSALLLIGNGFPVVATASYLARAIITIDGGLVHLSANDPRPLAQALDGLQQQYGWRINYEDPQYISKLDIVDAAKSSQKNEVARHYPAGGTFNVEFPVPTRDASYEETTLRLVVNAYNNTTNPGRFELRLNDGGDFYVTPVAARDRQGNLSKLRPVLDTSITLIQRQRTAQETISLILLRVSQKTGMKLNLGIFPLSLQSSTVNVGGSRVEARALLSRTLASTGRKFYWRMLFDPDTHSYFLNCMLANQK